MGKVWVSPPGIARSSTDYAYGMAFDAAFQAVTASYGPGEIPLFRALAHCLCHASGGFRVEEYHGNAHQVTFQGDGVHSRFAARCELSDLLIVVYAPSLQTARFTYLQAKSERATPYNPTQWPFKANLEQWDLLSRRPDVSGVFSNFDPPKDLLSSARMPSIGSFGIFYQTASQGYQMVYASGDCLTPTVIHSNRQGRVRLQGISHLRYSKGLLERTFTWGNSYFARDLYGLKIGEPLIVGGEPSDGVAAQWLAGIIRGLASRPGDPDQNRSLLSQLAEVLNFEDPVPEKLEFGAKRLILIGSDSSIHLSSDTSQPPLDPRDEDSAIVWSNPMLGW